MVQPDAVLHCLSPAKINHILHITGRRKDGYHLLQTVFQFVDLYDEIVFRLRDDDLIVRHGNDSIPESEDLMVRAAKKIKPYVGISPGGVDIRIKKRIPMGAGLGGGSSNAATVLLALNQLMKANLHVSQLMELGAELGADVPIFVHGQSAWAEGTGEVLSPIDLPEDWIALVIPPVHVSTAEVFGNKYLTRNQDPIKIRDFLDGMGSNICEPVVFSLYPQVKQAAHWLSKYGKVRMSGTGSSLFVVCKKRLEAQKIVEQLPKTWKGYVVQGINRSPMQKFSTGSTE